MRGGTFPSINPMNEVRIASIQAGEQVGLREVGACAVTGQDYAVVAAQAAFKRGSVWRQMDPTTRGEMLRKFAELIQRDAAYLAVSA